MTFVPMNVPAVLAASIWQKSNFLISFFFLNVYLTVYLNNLDFFGEKWWCPTLDESTHFPMHQWLPFLLEPQAKFAINITLVILWWVQHMLMANSLFKNFCYKTFGYQYAAIERSNYLFGTSVALALTMVFWQKNSVVVYNLLIELPKTMAVLPFVGFSLIAIGFVYFLGDLVGNARQ